LNTTGTRAVAAMGSAGIFVVDLTTSAPCSPPGLVPCYPVLGSYNTPGPAYSVVLNSAGTPAYVADGIGHLQVVNISNPSSPTFVANLSLGGNQVDLALGGNQLYMVSVTGSMDVVDLSSGAPQWMGNATLSGPAKHVAVEGSTV